MCQKEKYDRPEMQSVDIFGFSPVCTSPESYHEGDEGEWFDGDE